MKLDEFVTSARDMLSVRRVYGEPFEKDGVTVIPAASVAGGGGGGEGHDEKGGHGQGGGFGLGARPVGAYVVKAGEVRWVPAVDVSHVVTAASAVAVAFLFTRARVARAQAKAIAADRR